MWWLVPLFVVVIVLWFVWVRQQERFTLREIPKVIWTFWDSDNPPEFVQNSLDNWKRYSPDFEIKLVTPSNIGEYLPGIDFTKYKHTNFIQRVSDFVRVHLLAKYGGIWSDASVVAKRSHNWIIDEQKSKGFEVFIYRNDRDQTHPVHPVLANWFFACVPGAKFITEWRDEFDRTQDFDTIDDYIADIKAKGVDTQKIPDLKYLTQDVAAQVVIQTKMTMDTIYTLNSEDGPYKHSHSNGWDPPKSVKSLCDTPGHELPDLIKIYGNERRAIDADESLKCSYKIFD